MTTLQYHVGEVVAEVSHKYTSPPFLGRRPPGWFQGALVVYSRDLRLRSNHPVTRSISNSDAMHQIQSHLNQHAQFLKSGILQSCDQ